MINEFTRTEMLIGTDGVKKLRSARVAVFGAGGVGGYVIEALARSGVGAIDVIDGDEITITNINRQILALHSTIGKPKALVAEERIKQINPAAKVNAFVLFYTPENKGGVNIKAYDYVVDAVDTVAAKAELAVECQSAGVPIISCMGAGNKLDPTTFKVADIYSTKVCPLAKAMRSVLKKRGVKSLKVVYSEEEAIAPLPLEESAEEGCGKRVTPASIAFVPSVAGLILAGEVIKDLLKSK